MAVTSYKLPSTTAQADWDDGSAWTDLSNAEADDSNYANSIIPKDDTTDWLRVTNFSMGVPAGATIDGIEVQIKHDNRSGLAGRDVTDSEVFLRKVTTGQVGDNYADATDWTLASPETFTYGGSEDLWGTTWSAADVNNTAFGLDFSAMSSCAESDHVADIYFVKIRVYYTASGADINPKIKISDSFSTKPIKVKASGSFVEKTMKVKVGGAFQ